MKITSGVLSLHDGESFDDCIKTITTAVGLELLLEHGHEDHLSLCDQIARDNGYHEGLYDAQLSHLSTIGDTDTEPTQFFLPNWLAQKLVDYFEETVWDLDEATR